MSATAPDATAEPGGAAATERAVRGVGRRRRTLAVTTAVALAVAIVVAIAVLDPFEGSSGSQRGLAGGAGPTSEATVRRGPLSSQVYEAGTLDYAGKPDGSPYTAVNQASGPYTAVPIAGAVIRCGEVLYRVANDPVALLCGSTPAYRSLSEGTSGPDVRELNRNLVALGYASRSSLDPSSDYFGSETARALERLQERLGVAETGALELGDAVFLPGPIRITRVVATPGTLAQPGAPVAEASTTRRRVSVELDASQAARVMVGDRAEVTLPDNRIVAGRVTRVGTVASSAQGGSGDGGASDSSGATIPVYIRLRNAKAPGRLDQAPVQVQITIAGVKDAFSVPVTALVGLAGGGFALERVRADGDRELLRVTLGMFDDANGRVQVKGPGLAAGQRVVVPGE